MRHHVKQNTSGFAGVVYRNDVWMREARYGFDFLKKPFSSQRCRDIRVEHFHRDTAIVPRIARPIDGRHSTSADFVLDRVTVAECFLGSGCGQISGWETQ